MAQMKYYYELTISSSPHVHSPVTTRTLMRDVLIALIPALLCSVWVFGFRALTVTLVSAAAAFAFEKLYCIIMKQNDKTYDLSCLITGVLLAFVCPPTIPYWMIIVGDFFAIVLVKMLFGGIGKNIVNPALAGRAFMFSWPVAMSTWVKVVKRVKNPEKYLKFGSKTKLNAKGERARVWESMVLGYCGRESACL